MCALCRSRWTSREFIGAARAAQRELRARLPASFPATPHTLSKIAQGSSAPVACTVCLVPVSTGQDGLVRRCSGTRAAQQGSAQHDATSTTSPKHKTCCSPSHSYLVLLVLTCAVLPVLWHCMPRGLQAAAQECVQADHAPCRQTCISRLAPCWHNAAIRERLLRTEQPRGPASDRVGVLHILQRTLRGTYNLARVFARLPYSSYYLQTHHSVHLSTCAVYLTFLRTGHLWKRLGQSCAAACRLA